jgi:hypothetical protein
MNPTKGNAMEKLEFHHLLFTKMTDSETTSLNTTLGHSMGQPEMSAEDTKLALLDLKGLCAEQKKMIDFLVKEVTELKKNQIKNPFSR